MKTFTVSALLILGNLICFSQVTSFAIDTSKFNAALASQLESIYKSDQLVRIAVAEAKKQNAPPSVIDSLQKVYRETDHQNLNTVDSIIKIHGWLGPQSVGFNGAQGLFLVVQHADLQTQKRYLPIIRTAEKKGEILSSNLAILEDRINMRTGKKQLYGSQGFTDRQTGKKHIYPIQDVDNLDNRRKGMGMPPMKEYVNGWDPQLYKNELSEIERIVRVQDIR